MVFFCFKHIKRVYPLKYDQDLRYLHSNSVILLYRLFQIYESILNRYNIYYELKQTNSFALL